MKLGKPLLFASLVLLAAAALIESAAAKDAPRSC